MYPIIKTYFNREEHPCNYETNDLPSETVPDQTMSIRTILDRYSRGLPTSGMLNGTYQEDDEYNDMPDPKTLDLSERQELAFQAKQELEEIKQKINSKKYPKKTQGPGQSPDDGDEGKTLPPGKATDVVGKSNEIA